MPDWFRCTPCRTSFMLLTKPVDNKCPACGGTKGEVVFQEQMKQRFGAGTISPISQREDRSSGA